MSDWDDEADNANNFSIIRQSATKKAETFLNFNTSLRGRITSEFYKSSNVREGGRPINRHNVFEGSVENLRVRAASTSK